MVSESRRLRYPRERRQRARRYHTERKELIQRLGGKCSVCPCADFSKLEFDHPNGRPYDVAKLSRLSRLRRYRKEADEGKVRVLCRSCNARDGGARWYP